MTTTDIWQKTLSQLQLQITQATFEQWLRGSHLISQENDRVTVGVRSVYAREWLENRLAGVVQRTITNLAGHRMTIHYVVSGNNGAVKIVEDGEPNDLPAPTELPTAESFGVIFARETDFYTGKKDIGRWLPELQYDNLFWAPYLGKAYTFYRHLLIYWTKHVGGSKIKLLDMTRAENRQWTLPFRMSYRRATKWLGKSNQKLIPGGEYECHRSDMHHRMEIKLDKCCGAHDPCDWRPLAEGGGRCYYWRAGLLQRVYEEGLLKLEIGQTGRATVQVWRSLPLLTPHQVQQLNGFLQDEHERWLGQYGHYFDVSVEQWQSITEETLVPYLPGYDTSELTGIPPRNPFL